MLSSLMLVVSLLLVMVLPVLLLLVVLVVLVLVVLVVVLVMVVLVVLVVLGVVVLEAKRLLRYHNCSCAVSRAESLSHPPCSLYEHPSSRPGTTLVAIA